MFKIGVSSFNIFEMRPAMTKAGERPATNQKVTRMEAGFESQGRHGGLEDRFECLWVRVPLYLFRI